ncbi:MAG: response regulator transcription factor [Leptolyngbyaceae cyanobacterium RM2_2_4]|nr:response regulator transcription factor [Leptolyngbyaceae cyanobacterium SM1_4_3]NJO53223.1 response regulator transcription factor [Leptolyngbyaceae cyanobacterium RM2_2_4]
MLTSKYSPSKKWHCDVLLQELPESNEPVYADDLDAPLTPREVEVLQLLAAGLGNRALWI